MNFEQIIYSKRNSVKRALARFCHINKVNLNEEEFEIFVRRTQRAGYKSGVKYLSHYLKGVCLSNDRVRRLLFLFTIEYNTELYCKQFPLGNKSIQRILNGEKTSDDENFFKETLYDIVKANKLQMQIINKYI